MTGVANRELPSPPSSAPSSGELTALELPPILDTKSPMPLWSKWYGRPAQNREVCRFDSCQGYKSELSRVCHDPARFIWIYPLYLKKYLKMGGNGYGKTVRIFSRLTVLPPEDSITISFDKVTSASRVQLPDPPTSAELIV